MKKVFFPFIFILTLLVSCQNVDEKSATTSSAAEVAQGGQSGVSDDISQKDIVKVAAGSADHTTLVAAVKAGELVDALSNAGPFTVFAPTNTAFDQLPKGTVEGLLKPDKKGDLQNILQYHVTLSALETTSLTDGRVLGMVNGDNATISVKDGKITINGANIVASIRASNGMVHVIDKVLLPPAK